MLADLVEEDALNLDADDRLWVPQAPDVRFRPLLFSVSQGYFVNLLRVRKAGILSRHRHTGPVPSRSSNDSGPVQCRQRAIARQRPQASDGT